jgi:hypothetical protein
MTKKMFLAAAIGLVMFSGSSLFAARVSPELHHLDADGNGVFNEGEVDPCMEYRSGPVKCVCTYPVTKFRKKTYCTTRCVKEPYTVTKECTRYVPQYYTKTFCRKVPEKYCVNETRYRTRTIKEEHCRYEPYTFCKTECRECPDMPVCPPVGAQGGCGPEGCPVGPSDYNHPYAKRAPGYAPSNQPYLRKSHDGQNFDAGIDVNINTKKRNSRHY